MIRTIFVIAVALLLASGLLAKDDARNTDPKPSAGGTNFRSSFSVDKSTMTDFVPAKQAWSALSGEAENILKREKLSSDYLLRLSNANMIAPLGRMPSADYAMQYPLAFPQYVMERLESWQTSPFPFTLFCKKLANGPGLESLASLNASIYTFDDDGVHGQGVRVYSLPPNFAKGLPPASQKILDSLYTELYISATLCNEAFQELAPEELEYIKKNAPLFFRNALQKNSAAFSGLSTEDLLRLSDILRKVDMVKIHSAAALAEFAVRSFNGDVLREDLGKMADEEIVYRDDTPFGRIIIGGNKNNIYVEDAALIIDIGGNDTYKNNAGGAFLGGPAVAVCIDLGGDDTYETKGRAFTLGAAFCGVGILFDRDGNDRYTSGDYSLGAGLLGVGEIWESKGNDVYQSGFSTQGFGLFGFGVLLDDRGDDQYSVTGLSQGVAGTLGVGFFVDALGNDRYGVNADPNIKSPYNGSFVQGAGVGLLPTRENEQVAFYGGLGFLYDSSGDDVYQAVEYSQGCGFGPSAGVLIDCSGNDKYFSTKRSQGFGANKGCGALLELIGNDGYVSSGISQGANEVGGVGILFDAGGDDSYRAATGLGFSCAEGGLAVLGDFKGDDVYECSKIGLGFSEWTFQATSPASGIFLDGGGGDSYRAGFVTASDNLPWKLGAFGFGKDYSTQGKTVLRLPNLPQKSKVEIDIYRRFHDNRSALEKDILSRGDFRYLEKYPIYQRRELLDLLRLAVARQASGVFSNPKQLFSCLRSDDFELRFAGIELLSLGGDNVREEISQSSEHAAVLREISGVKKTSADLSGKIVKELLSAGLGHKQKETRFATVLAFTRLDCAEGLLKALDDSESCVRAAAASAVKRLERQSYPRFIEPLLEHSKDSSPIVRHNCVSALGYLYQCGVEIDRNVFVDLANSDDPLTAFPALTAVMEEIPDAVPRLIKLLECSDETVKREVAAVLGELTSQDFQGDYQKWTAWYDQKRTAEFNERYERINRQISEGEQLLSSGKYDDAIAALKKGYLEDPDNELLKKRIASVLNRHAWKLCKNKSSALEAEKLARAGYVLLNSRELYDTLKRSLELQNKFEEIKILVPPSE